MPDAIRTFKRLSTLLDVTGQTGIIIVSSGTPSFLPSTGSGNVARPAGSLAIASGKTFTVNNTLTFSGTDTSSVAFGTGGTVAFIGASQTWTGSPLFQGAGVRFQDVGLGILTLNTSASQTNNHAVTITSNDADSDVFLNGDVTFAAAFTTSGANALTLTTTGATNVTLPTSGTLVNTAVTSLSSLATVGTITSGTWNGATIGYAYGGTNATTQSAAVANLRGVPTFADLAAMTAATPTVDGQLAITENGSAAIGFSTAAGGYVADGVAWQNPNTYFKALEAQGNITHTTGTSQLRSLTVSSGNVGITAGDLSLYNGTLYQTATSGQCAIFLGNSTSALMEVRSSTNTKPSALEARTSDNNGGVTLLAGNSASGSPYQGKLFIDFFYGLDDGTATGKCAPVVLRRYGRYAGVDEGHYWIGCDSDGNTTIYTHTNGVSEDSAIPALAVSAAGNTTLGGGATASELRFLEPSGSGTNYTAFKAQAQGANITYTLPSADGSSGEFWKTNGSGTLSWTTSGTDYVHPSQANIIASGRLTLTSATPVLTGNVTGAGTVFFTPHNGNAIALYTGSAWKTMTFSQLSITLSALSASTVYDVFAYDNSGTVALETVAWTDATTRATALAYQDGVLVKSGATTRRFIGSFVTDASKQCSVDFGSFASDGSQGAQFDIWNMNHRVRACGIVGDNTNSWTYTTAAWRSVNGSDSNRVTFLQGLADDGYEARAFHSSTTSSAVTVLRWTGIGVDSTSAALGISPGSGTTAAGGRGVHVAEFSGNVLGQHYIQQLEMSAATGTTTWYGDNGGDGTQNGLVVSFYY